MLLAWSRAYAFAHLNNLEMHTSSWLCIHWGALLRRERKKRFYFRHFKQAGLLKKLRFLLYILTKNKTVEPPVETLSKIDTNQLFVFNKIFLDYDFFKEIRPYRELVKKGIFDMLRPEVKEQYNLYKKPVIGMHIRRGDFNRGSTITPLTFLLK